MLPLRIGVLFSQTGVTSVIERTVERCLPSIFCW